MAVSQSVGIARWRPSWAPAVFNSRRAWHAWLIVASVIGALAAWQPDRTVTNNYRDACRHWFAGRAIYEGGPHGFLYFPHAAILYAPFTILPSPFGGVAWRLVSIGSLALAVWRLAALLTPETKKGFAFAVLTCLVIPPALPSARNGQMNLVLSALLTLAFVEIAYRRWWWAACWLCLGAAFKPLIIAPLAVAAVAYRPLRRPLICSGLALLVAPFFTQHPGYVWEQYQACALKLVLAGNPGWENPGSDLFGLLASVGYFAPLEVQTATRVAAGCLTLALALIAIRSARTAVTGAGDAPHTRSALLVLGLTTCYLALFNPRMENNGFVLIAPTMGVFAIDAFLGRRRRFIGWMMVAASIVIACYYQLAGGYNFWLCPLMGLIVWLYTIIDACREPARELLLGGPAADTAS
jgi:alpha-1,2-mannosyltransferase